jgi:hypothetical protein
MKKMKSSVFENLIDIWYEEMEIKPEVNAVSWGKE